MYFFNFDMDIYGWEGVKRIFASRFYVTLDHSIVRVVQNVVEVDKNFIKISANRIKSTKSREKC